MGFTLHIYVISKLKIITAAIAAKSYQVCTGKVGLDGKRVNTCGGVGGYFQVSFYSCGSVIKYTGSHKEEKLSLKH